MFAYVKFLDDNVCKVVPITFINNFVLKEWSVRSVYKGFWAPKSSNIKNQPDLDTLYRPKEDGTGFYRATVLKLAG